MPGWAVGAVLLPVLVGLLLGRAAERELSWLPALAASVAAAVIVAATAAGLTALGAGSLGVDRFVSVGPDAGPVALWLCLELVLGALLWLLGSAAVDWVQGRRSSDMSDATSASARPRTADD
jgi:hypothetical protein